MTRSTNPAANTASTGVLKKLLCASVIGGLFALTASANAATVTFDGVQNIVTPQLNAGDTTYNTGDAFTQAGFTLRVANNAAAEADEYGLVGALIDSDNNFNCSVIACPVGNGSNYFAGLNDGSLNITNTSDGVAGFRLAGLSYAFVAPLAGLVDASYGRLLLTGTVLGGGTISTSADFAGQDASGRFTFAQLGAQDAFGGTILTSLSLNACLFDAGMTGCYSAPRDFTQNQAQFALENLDLSEVPEPTSVALMLLGLAGLGSMSRRRRN